MNKLRLSFIAFFFAVLCLLMAIPTELLAQSGGTAGAYSRLGFGTRGMGLGNAMGTITQEGIYAHYNPALASWVNGNQIDIGTSIMSFDRSLHMINATFALPPHAGLNIGLINANVDNIDGRTQSGYHTGMLSTHDYQLFAAFGLAISERVRFGASVKLHLANYHSDIGNATGSGFDIGMIINPIRDWRIGISIHDILSQNSWDTRDLYGEQSGTSKKDAIPVRYKFSTSYFIQTWSLLVSSEYEIQKIDRDYVVEQVAESQLPPSAIFVTEEKTSYGHLFRIGSAWYAHERITFRVGWEVLNLDYISETHKISFGTSIHLPYDFLRPSIDYAYIREPMGISGIHSISLRLHF